jgi:hypothetical protein
MSAARVVEMVTSEGFTPIFEHPNRTTFGDVPERLIPGISARPDPERAEFSRTQYC